MTELAEQAIERVCNLSPGTQDDFARVLLGVAGDDEVVYQRTWEEAGLAGADEGIARGAFAKFAKNERSQAAWAKSGLCRQPIGSVVTIYGYAPVSKAA